MLTVHMSYYATHSSKQQAKDQNCETENLSVLLVFDLLCFSDRLCLRKIETCALLLVQCSEMLQCHVIIHRFCFDHLSNLFMLFSSWIYYLTYNKRVFIKLFGACGYIRSWCLFKWQFHSLWRYAASSE